MYKNRTFGSFDKNKLPIRLQSQEVKTLCLHGIVRQSCRGTAAGDDTSVPCAYDGAGNAMRHNTGANIGGYTAGEYKYRLG